MKEATVVLIDEVNCKIKGLDVKLRRKISKMFTYDIPYARHTPAFKLGRWNGKVSFFQLGGSTYINLLDQILPVIMDEGYEIDLIDNRIYKEKIKILPIGENLFFHITWPGNHPKAGEPIIFRDHQVDAVNNFINNPQSLQEISTSAGKTVITAALSHLVEPYGRSIIIVPNRSLVEQTKEDYDNIGLDVGVFFGDKKDFTKKHTICTWQSLNSLYKKTKKGEAPIPIDEFLKDVVAVIVDEVHSASADVLKTMLSSTFANIPIRWGLTGTIPKEKFQFEAIRCTIGNVVGQVTAKSLQDKGILANCHIHIKQLQDNRVFNNYQSELKYLLSDNDRLDQIASMISDISEAGNTLVLVDRINAGQTLTERLRRNDSWMGLSENIVFVNGTTKAEDRKEHYNKVHESRNMILVATYGVAAVGINLPSLRNIVLIEPGKSFVRVIQSIGRGLRVTKEKDYVDIWDITSNCKFAKRHLTTRKKFYKEAQYPFKVQKVNY